MTFLDEERQGADEEQTPSPDTTPGDGSTAQPDEPTDEQPKQDEPEAVPPPELDLTSIPLDKLLEREDFQRHLQSQTDKAIAAAERRAQDAVQRQKEQEELDKYRAELERLLEDEDYEELGKRTASTLTEQKELTKAADKLTVVIKQSLRENPEFASLGDDEITKIERDVQGSGGSVVEYMSKLHAAVKEKAVEAERAKLSTNVDEQVDAKVKALLQEQGLLKREEAVASGAAVSPAVSENASPRAPAKAKTWVQIQDEYGAGEITTQEYNAARKAHLEGKI